MNYMNVMGRDSNILRANSTAKRAFGYYMIARKCSQAYEAQYSGDKLYQTHPYRTLKTFQENKIHWQDNHKKVNDEKLSSSLLRKISDEQLRTFLSHMARVEWLASLGTLSATVAHESMQPLTVIRLSLDDALDRLEAAPLPRETVIRGLKEVQAQVSNLTSIIERFRNLARKSPEKVVDEISVKVVAEKVVNMLRKSARLTRIELHLREMDRLPPVRLNEREIEQLFYALVENAIQAADGKKARQLNISGAVKDHCIELCFSDNCGGIAPEYLDEIFKPFVTTKPAGQGTGLGLCIVKKIVSHAGGRIRVESEFGKSSAFFVTLPVSENSILRLKY